MKMSMFDCAHVIMSAMQAGMTDEQESDSFDRLVRRLNANGYRTQVATGHFSGGTERSVIVMFTEGEPFQRLAYLSALACKDFRQESIVYIDPQGNGFLCDDTGRMKYLGVGVIHPGRAPVNGDKTLLPDGRTIAFI